MQVNFLTKLVALKPGNVVEEMIKNVMLGKDEGADDLGDDEEDTSRAGGQRASRGIAGRVSLKSTPWMLLQNMYISYGIV